MSLTKEELRQALVDKGAVTAEQFEKASQAREAREIGIGETLVAHGDITERQLNQLVAWWHGVPSFDFDKEAVEQKTLELIPESFAREHFLIPVKCDDKGVAVATSDPKDIVLCSLLEKYLRRRVRCVFATERQIAEHLFLFQKDPKEIINKILKQKIETADGLDSTVVSIVDAIINYAYQVGVSDIHFDPEETYTAVRFRIDGSLKDVSELPAAMHVAVMARLKVMSRLATDEHRKAQDGKIIFKTPWRESVEIRLSIVPTTHHEKAVMRLLSDKNRRFALNDLGFQPSDFQKISEVIHRPWGMILVSGPTGSGKTTTLYSVLKILNERDVNIVTIEDPVEYDMDGVSQIQVDEKVDLTFAKGLRSIVRQDPDIIMVGEIRDKETAGISINAAMTGHLLLSTIHTNDAATVFPRLIDMGIEDYLIASTINVIISQRLVRRLCLNCVQSKFLSLAEIKMIERVAGAKETLLRLGGKDDLSKVRLFEGKGCHICHQTGFKDRVGIFEVLTVTENIREAIMTHRNADEICQIARKEGMASMLEDGLLKTTLGMTTVGEVLSETQSSF